MIKLLSKISKLYQYFSASVTARSISKQKYVVITFISSKKSLFLA